ncbi:hypothetical protein M409DRAFT_30719 [Zasmidium cellare ATCC 36951]|uniref:Uncharacterized protein n=1 Tax=Zasmidium cellare ATCC 36951 TaxID=1080233 RepID=A0A6A6BXI0_ZASCE|nr:uncharacterized protein M409DRAFT_30719 [Zasmidium cellare ATCC 36951]KAF2158758.1 hypothetical protein M409DRAFT_30719 [Zasmidium cellare ATCC 36951]
MTAQAFRSSGLPMEMAIGALGKHLERVETQLEAEDLQHQIRVMENFNYLAEQRITVHDMKAGENALQIIFNKGQGVIDASNVQAGHRALQLFGNGDMISFRTAVSEHTSRTRLCLGSECGPGTAEPTRLQDGLAARIKEDNPATAAESVHNNFPSDEVQKPLPGRYISWKRIMPFRKTRHEPKSQ